MNPLEVDVQVVGENGAIYKGFVTDVFDDEVEVAFENDSPSECRFAFNFVKLPSTNNSRIFFENQEVEVLSKLSEQDTGRWWKAVIKLIKGESHVVEYISGTTNNFSYTEIVTVDRLRHVNTNPPIDRNTFFKFEIDVPDQLREYASLDGVHKEFQKRIKAPVCRYSQKDGKLVVISRCGESRRLATMMKDLHFRNLGLKISVMKRTRNAARQIESTIVQNRGRFSEEFQVRKDLLDLAIGEARSNIELAGNVEGITFIDVHEPSCTFTIYGETKEAIKMTRNSILEYIEESVQVPQNLVNDVIGKDCINLEEFKNKCGVAHVKIEGQYDEKPIVQRKEPSVFHFVGTVESISNAKLLLEYHLAVLQEVEKLRQEKVKINQRLSSRLHDHGNNSGSIQAFSAQRINDRALNSGVEFEPVSVEQPVVTREGRGRGRGRPRGRGRGRGGRGGSQVQQETSKEERYYFRKNPVRREAAAQAQRANDCLNDEDNNAFADFVADSVDGDMEEKIDSIMLRRAFETAASCQGVEVIVNGSKIQEPITKRAKKATTIIMISDDEDHVDPVDHEETKWMKPKKEPNKVEKAEFVAVKSSATSNIISLLSDDEDDD